MYVVRSGAWTLGGPSGYGDQTVSAGQFLVRHVGRRTGLTYETPLVLARVPDGFVAELTYGPNVDWYRNVTAAGRCVVVQYGVEYSVDRIEPCSTADGLAAFGSLRSLALRVLRRREFRHLHVGPAAGAVGS